MKKLFYAIAALAVVASCAKVAEVETNIEPKEENNLVHMTILAQAPQTKTYIDQTGAKTYQPGWNQGDQLAVFFDTVKDNKDAVLDNYGDTGKAAEFNGDVTIANGPHTVYGFYPATTVFKKGDSETKVELQVATVQRPLAYSFDPDADIAVGKALGINVESSDVTINNMVFARLLSTVKVTITESNGDIDPGEKINAITICSSESNLTGVIEWDYDKQLATAVSDDNTVTADLSADPIAFGTPIFVLVNPTTMSAGSSLVITVSTDSHEITKTISLSGAINFPLGGIAELNINLDNTVAVGAAIEEPTPSSNGWFLVKKAHWLRPGDEVAIVGAENNVAMSTTQNNNNRGQVDVTISSEELTITDNVQRFTIESGTVANTIAFKCINGEQANKFIYAASSSSNYLKSEEYKEDNASFYILIDENSVATVMAMGNNTHNFLRYNKSSSIFSCYNVDAGVKEAVRIFKNYSITVPSLSTPTNLEAIAVDDDVMVSWNAVAGANSYTVTCGTNVQTGITDTDYTFENLEDDTYTVTVKAISNDHSILLDSGLASTTVTVSTSDYSGYYLIGAYANTKWQLMNSEIGSNSYYPKYDSSVSADIESVSFNSFSGVSDIDKYIWKVEKYDGAYSIKSVDTEKYVSYEGAANAAFAVDDLAASAKFKITIDADKATIESYNVAGRNLKYNSSSPRFAFYTTAQTDIFMIPATYDDRTVVTLSFAKASLNYTTSNYGDCTGQTATASPNVTAITSNIEYALSGDAIGTVNATSGAVTLNGTEGTATITASFEGDATYRPAQKSYTITVTAAGIPTPYSTGFESSEGFTASSDYQSTVTVGPDGKQWEIFYGTVSTSSKITGDNSLAMRLYSSNNYAYAEMKFDVPGATEVSFKAKASTSNGASIKVTIKESTDGGESWTAVSGWSAKSLTSSAASYSFTVDGAPDKYRIRFEIDPSSTKPSKSNAQLTIDDFEISID